MELFSHHREYIILVNPGSILFSEVLNLMDSIEKNAPRKGCVDCWNAFMVKGAKFSNNDIPFCPTTASSVPTNLISFDDAKAIHKKAMKNGNKDYFVNSFIHFWIDDQKFDGKRSSIWLYPEKALEVIKHFAGIITPDFSTYADFPEPLKIYNTYIMRAFGYWVGKNGISVINNVRWGTPETYWYTFDGIPKNSIVAIGTVASGIRMLKNRERFTNGIFEMVDRLEPHTIIVYGSSNLDCFDVLREKGINIITFPSKTSQVFEGRKHNV